jgi:hypothetical protein
MVVPVGIIQRKEMPVNCIKPGSALEKKTLRNRLAKNPNKWAIARTTDGRRVNPAAVGCS